MDEQKARQAAHAQIDRLVVPDALVDAAIDQGLARSKPKHHVWRWVLGAAAAVVLATAGLGKVNPTVGQALSNVPWLSSFYTEKNATDNFNSYHTSGIAKSQDQKVTSNGVTVHLVEAFYNGRTVGVTGEVTGVKIKIDPTDDDDSLPMDIASKPTPNFLVAMSHTQVTDSGFRFHVTYHVQADTLPSHVTLPLKITNIYGVDGHWNLRVPVSQTMTTHQIAQKPYALGLKNASITPVSMTTFSSGAEFTYRNTKDDTCNYLALASIETLDGKDLIDDADSYATGFALDHLPLTQPLVRGQAYLVRYRYELANGYHNDEQAQHKLVLWP